MDDGNVAEACARLTQTEGSLPATVWSDALALAMGMDRPSADLLNTSIVAPATTAGSPVQRAAYTRCQCSNRQRVYVPGEAHVRTAISRRWQDGPPQRRLASTSTQPTGAAPYYEYNYTIM